MSDLRPASAPNQESTRNRSASTLDKQLFAYAAAATAAGVGLIAASQPAEAKIVYTAANVTIPTNTFFPLDVNNDGSPDFVFFFYTYGPRIPLAPPLGFHDDNLALFPSASSKTGNEILGFRSGNVECAMALPPAVKVGAGAAFQANPVLLAGSAGSAYSTKLLCKFENLHRGAYLGLKFLINGQTHYGWAHVSGVHHNQAMLDGYAYETVPNQPILTGATSGFVPDTKASAMPLPRTESATLGLLARGADSMALWRRPEEIQQN